MGQVLVTDPALDRRIRRTPQPTPPVVRGRILRVKNEVDRIRFAEKRSGNAKPDFIVDRSDCAGIDLFALAPSPFLPAADKAASFVRSSFCAKKEMGVEG